MPLPTHPLPSPDPLPMPSPSLPVPPLAHSQSPSNLSPTLSSSPLPSSLFPVHIALLLLPPDQSLLSPFQALSPTLTPPQNFPLSPLVSPAHLSPPLHFQSPPTLPISTTTLVQRLPVIPAPPVDDSSGLSDSEFNFTPTITTLCPPPSHPLHSPHHPKLMPPPLLLRSVWK
ncbi:hypothetical protein EDB89DRAFT_2067599 [Lactarius sanguifluus]|nr:hypothetical protein EDB89DRAFT_2067599 [Lactarius sanguifluus]